MHRPGAYSGWMCLVTHCCITQIAAAKWDITLQLLSTTAASCSTCGNPFETFVSLEKATFNNDFLQIADRLLARDNEPVYHSSAS
jgi:hypothetical protein